MHGQTTQRDLEARAFMSQHLMGRSRESSGAYKDIDEVIAATELAGISKPGRAIHAMGDVKG